MSTAITLIQLGITTVHDLTFKMAFVACPNKCGELDLIQLDLDAHRQTCVLEVISCKYARAGCSEKMKRQDMLQYMVACQGQHLEMVKEENKELHQELEVTKQYFAKKIGNERSNKRLFEKELSELKLSTSKKMDVIKQEVKCGENDSDEGCILVFVHENPDAEM